MTLANAIEERGISEILHFTTQQGVVGILATNALKSRFRLPQDSYLQHILYPNAASRPEAQAEFDKKQNWLDYVNLSVSEINKSYFDFSTKWHNGNEIWWAILSFSAEICSHDGVHFGTTNNSYEFCERGMGEAGFLALFAKRIARKGTWSVTRASTRPDSLPTCQQAEVLYPEAVSTSWLRKIYVMCGEHHDLVSGWLREFRHAHVQVVISPEKFNGQPN